MASINSDGYVHLHFVSRQPLPDSPDGVPEMPTPTGEQPPIPYADMDMLLQSNEFRTSGSVHHPEDPPLASGGRDTDISTTPQSPEQQFLLDSDPTHSAGSAPHHSLPASAGGESADAWPDSDEMSWVVLPDDYNSMDSSHPAVDDGRGRHLFPSFLSGTHTLSANGRSNALQRDRVENMVSGPGERPDEDYVTNRDGMMSDRDADSRQSDDDIGFHTPVEYDDVDGESLSPSSRKRKRTDTSTVPCT